MADLTLDPKKSYSKQDSKQVDQLCEMVSFSVRFAYFSLKHRRSQETTPSLINTKNTGRFVRF